MQKLLDEIFKCRFRHLHSYTVYFLHKILYLFENVKFLIFDVSYKYGVLPNKQAENTISPVNSEFSHMKFSKS